MKFLTKTISGLLIVALLVPNLFFVAPKMSQAQEVLPVPTKDAALRSEGCGLSFFGVCVPFTSLNSFAWFAAKLVIRQLTADIVNWINSGFDGNPAFVTNPAGFFTDIVDEQIGLMISESSDLKFLCTPFSLDIRLALAFKYRPFRKKVTCTLTDIIKNSKNAVDGASINGFTKGDFKQGGWPAFISMTTEPQNNVYGAYMEAESELSLRIGNKQILKGRDLGAGRGFLSKEVCKPIPKAGDDAFVGPVPEGGAAPQEFGPQPAQAEQYCEVKTPGSVIEGQLNETLGTNLRQLELADSFNEIVNALAAQLVTQVLTKGLSAVSGKGPSDPQSYLNNIQKEAATQNEQLKSIKEKVIPQIDLLLKTENTYKGLKTETVDKVLEAKHLLDDAKACFTAKKNQNNNLKFNDAQIINQNLAEIENTVGRTINPLGSQLLTDLERVTKNIGTLTGARLTITNAYTVNDTIDATKNVSSLTETQSLTTDTDITKATKEKNDVTLQMNSINSDTTLKIQQCSLL